DWTDPRVLRGWGSVDAGDAGAVPGEDRLRRGLHHPAVSDGPGPGGNTNQMFTVREVNTAGVRGKLNFVMPLIVGLVDDAAQRARPLQRTGIGEPGPRTVLNPVANPAGQRILRWVLIAATCAAIVWIGVS